MGKTELWDCQVQKKNPNNHEASALCQACFVAVMLERKLQAFADARQALSTELHPQPFVPSF
jgi:hypothetical protein